MLTQALLLLALSIPTLSLPSPNDNLHKRDTNAWIGAFSDTDVECQSGVVNTNRPEMRIGKCVVFAPATQNVGT